MDYHIDDAYGYVGSLGIFVELDKLINFLNKKDPVFQEFFDEWNTENILKLKKALEGVTSKNKEMNKEIAHFREVLSRCKIIAVINDGCNDYYQFDTQDQGGYNSKEQQCGLDIFSDFKFQNISNAHPPDKPGVFVIKIRKPGTDEIEIYNELISDFENIKWATMQDAYTNRLDKIVHMSNCPILYIGSAGTNMKSRQTLASHYHELAYCHPIQYYLWALLHYNWKLDFGWKVCDNPKKYAAEIKTMYVKHHGQMPMMVEREEH